MTTSTGSQGRGAPAAEEGEGDAEEGEGDVDGGQGEGRGPHEVLTRRIVFDLLLVRVTVELRVSSRLL